MRMAHVSHLPSTVSPLFPPAVHLILGPDPGEQDSVRHHITLHRGDNLTSLQPIVQKLMKICSLLPPSQITVNILTQVLLQFLRVKVAKYPPGG